MGGPERALISNNNNSSNSRISNSNSNAGDGNSSGDNTPSALVGSEGHSPSSESDATSNIEAIASSGSSKPEISAANPKSSDSGGKNVSSLSSNDIPFQQVKQTTNNNNNHNNNTTTTQPLANSSCPTVIIDMVNEENEDVTLVMKEHAGVSVIMSYGGSTVE